MADKFRYSKDPVDDDVRRLQRETEDNFFSKDKNGNLVFDGDIECDSVKVKGESLYIGGVKFKSPIHSNEDGYWKYNRENKQFDFTATANPEPHASDHEVGGNDLVTHDSLTGFVADEHIDWTSTSENIVTTGTIYGKGYRINIVAKTAAYTATAADDVITCGAGNQTFTIDLPAPLVGKTYYIKNVGTGVITVDADTTGSTTIDGDTTQTINQYECLKVVSDASVYWSI